MTFTMDDVRDQFPILSTSRIHVNHALYSPLPRCAAEAMNETITNLMMYGWNPKAVQLTIEECRNGVATLIGADAHDIAFLQNTTQAVSVVAQGLPWKQGDEIIVPSVEYPANIIPWLTLADRGVKVLFIDPQADGSISIDTIEKRLSPRTRLVAISHVQYRNGFRINIQKVATLCKRSNVLLLVNAVQSMGVFPIYAVSWGIDFLVGTTCKWLMGPPGIGILYVRRELLDAVKPLFVGSRGVIVPQNWKESQGLHFLPTAGRFESGTTSYSAYFGLKKSLDMILNLGVPVIKDKVEVLIKKLYVSLATIGFQVHSPQEGESWSGIISCSKKGVTAEAIIEVLKQHDVGAVVRFGYVRFSPHFYNTLDQIFKIVDILKKSF